MASKKAIHKTAKKRSQLLERIESFLPCIERLARNIQTEKIEIDDFVLDTLFITANLKVFLQHYLASDDRISALPYDLLFQLYGGLNFIASSVNGNGDIESFSNMNLSCELFINHCTDEISMVQSLLFTAFEKKAQSTAT